MYCWMLAACGIGLLGGDTCCWNEYTASVFNRVWKDLRNKSKPPLLNLSLLPQSFGFLPAVKSCNNISPHWRLCIRLTLYYITYDNGFTCISQTGTQGVRPARSTRRVYPRWFWDCATLTFLQQQHVVSTITKRSSSSVDAKGSLEHRSTPCRTPTVALTKASQSHQMVMSQCVADRGVEGG